MRYQLILLMFCMHEYDTEPYLIRGAQLHGSMGFPAVQCRGGDGTRKHCVATERSVRDIERIPLVRRSGHVVVSDNLGSEHNPLRRFDSAWVRGPLER
jgi:hypothetical protein